MNTSILKALRNPEEKKPLTNSPLPEFEGCRKISPNLVPINTFRS